MSKVATALPAVLRELLQMDSAQAASEIRRRTRCTPKEALDLYRSLPNGIEAVVRYPNEVAQLLEDPQPRLLTQLRPQRSRLLRLLRRGNRLEAMRLLMEEGLSPSEARQFAQAVTAHAEHWQALERLYTQPPADFWTRRPQPEPPPESSIEMLIPPAEFDPHLCLEWLARGQYRPCTTWVRQASGASREDCQKLVDRLDELLFDGDPDPWGTATLQFGEIVAALAGLPSPDWLNKLKGRRHELLDLNPLPAAELVAREVGCSTVQARRFLRRLGDGSNWDSTLKAVSLGKVFSPQIKPAAPAPVVAAAAAIIAPIAAVAAAPVVEEIVASGPVAPVATELCGPDTDGGHLQLGVSHLRAMPWETVRTQENAEVEKARQAFEKERAQHLAQDERQRAEEVKREARKLEEARRKETEATRSDTHLPQAGQVTLGVGLAAAAAMPGAPKPLNLQDTDALLDRLSKLGQACSRKDWREADRLYEELETAGFNRSWVVKRFPALLPFLPEDPWSDKLEHLGPTLDSLAKVLRGEVTPAQLAAQALKATNLDKVVTSLETAWKTRKKSDLEEAVKLLKQHPDLAEEINQRVPWLSELMDDGKAGEVLEAISDPVAYFGELIKKHAPELEERLGHQRLESIKQLLPELLQSMKERNMRGVMRVMARLRLGPSDVKAVLGLLKMMHR